MNLLSEKDLQILQAALDSLQEIELQRRLGEVLLVAKTSPSDRAWPDHVKMLLQICRIDGHVTYRQNFINVQQLLQYWPEY